MFEKTVFYLLKPLMDRALTEKAKEYIDELGRRTALPSRFSSSAKRSIRMYFTFGSYSRKNAEALRKRYLLGINDEKIRYEISVFDRRRYSKIAFAAGCAIRRSVSRFYDFFDTPLTEGFFGESGRLILENLPEIESCSPEEYERALKAGEAMVKKIREFKNLGEKLNEGSFTYRDYLELFREMESEISAPGVLRMKIPEKYLRKIYDSGKKRMEKGKDIFRTSTDFTEYFFPFLQDVEFIALLQMEYERGKIIAVNNKNKILERRKVYSCFTLRWQKNFSV